MELRHFGILGMKWGVRRYQNKDGTLTEAGKKRYGSDFSRVRSKAAAKQVDNYVTSASGYKKLESFNRNVDKAKAESKELAALRKARDDAEKKVLDELNSNNGRLSKQGEENYNNYWEQANRYNAKVDEIVFEQRNVFAKDVLSGMGYEYTEAGRDYVNKVYPVIGLDWYD